MKMEKQLIGRIDRVDFPTVNLHNVKVKIDTGAYSSSIHCDLIEEISDGESKILKVIFLDPRNHSFSGQEVCFDSFVRKEIKSSNGIIEERYVVELEILIFSKSFLANFSLTNREMLKYPVLLGRQLLNGNFIVDTNRTNLSYNLKKIK